MNVVFATCEQQPLIARDDEPLAAALAARGVAVEPIPWTELDPYAVLDAPHIVLRSTWDYHRVPTMFAAWLAALGDSGRTVWNPAAIAAGNVDKIYLQRLEAAGVPIPRTRWIDRIEAGDVERVLSAEGWPRAVLKPRIAATAFGTFLVDRSTQLSDDDLIPARSSGAMLQEFVPDITNHGEISMVYLDGAFSHAVQKHAKDGDFRVQQDFGGRVIPFSPTPEMAALGARVMALVPAGCLYARVDLVPSSRGPLLMELELIEPELYFQIVPEAADLMAQIITSRMHP